MVLLTCLEWTHLECNESWDWSHWPMMQLMCPWYLGWSKTSIRRFFTVLCTPDISIGNGFRKWDMTYKGRTRTQVWWSWHTEIHRMPYSLVWVLFVWSSHESGICRSWPRSFRFTSFLCLRVDIPPHRIVPGQRDSERHSCTLKLGPIHTMKYHTAFVGAVYGSTSTPIFSDSVQETQFHLLSITFNSRYFNLETEYYSVILTPTLLLTENGAETCMKDRNGLLPPGCNSQFGSCIFWMSVWNLIQPTFYKLEFNKFTF